MKSINFLSCALVLFSLLVVSIYLRTPNVQASTSPELPRELLDTRYVAPTGSTINVPAGGDFQAALDAARPGDTIVLQAGASYLTPPDGFVLPGKPGATWIVIRTSNMAGLPTEGSRVTPANAPAMPKIITTGVFPTVRTAPGAHHYRFIGIEFAVAAGLPLNYGIVTLGESTTLQRSLDSVPHDIIIDRGYIHGNDTGDVSRGVALNSARTAIIDSHISNCHGVGYDTQAIAGWNGPGPFKIVNNYLAGAAENVLFGGAEPGIANLVPSDIEFRRNHCHKPLSWKQGDPAYAGTSWWIKNIFELKNAQRVLVDGNIFENHWVAQQSGPAILFTPRGEDGRVPWTVVQDITFTNNIVRHSAAAIALTGYDDGGPSLQTRRVKIANNLFDDIGGARWGGNGRFIQILDGTADVTIDHNTVFHTAQVVIVEGRTHAGFVYTNNLSRHNEYGLMGTGASTGYSTLNTYFPGYLFAKNLMAGGPSHLYPSDNFFPGTLSDIGFVDLAGGNYRLSSASQFRRAGTDGRDIGADIDAIEAAISGGAAPPPPPPPPAAGDIVLYVSAAPVKAGSWVVTSDPTAAGGAGLFNPDQGVPKIITPPANPADYFQMSFAAEAGRPYRLWVRARAQSNSPYNDSIFAQFSDSVDSGGAAVFRIGTGSATTMNLEDCSGCGLQGWGWQDNGWGVGVMGPPIYFQSTGSHTIKVQPREDGIYIDQIILSPVTYLDRPPGALRNDNTILPRTDAEPPPAPAPTVTSVAPGSGPAAGGTAVTITGSGFMPGASVVVGGSPASSVNVNGGASISAVTPAHSAGAVDIVVTNPDGRSGTLTNGFTYTPPAAEAVLLADDFNDNSLDASRWDASNLFSGYTDLSLTLREINQRLEIGPLQAGATGSHYRGIKTRSTYDFTGAYCHVELVQSPLATTQADAMLTIGRDVSGYYRIYVEAGALICQKRINGTKTNLLTIPYVPNSHRYWRIRHDRIAGDVLFETAAGVAGEPGVWTTLHRERWDSAAIPLAAIQFEMKAGTWQAESSAAGTIIFDNFKLAKP